jgi:hypothetical protein
LGVVFSLLSDLEREEDPIKIRLHDGISVQHKQFVVLKNYRSDDREQLVADHFWPLTRRSIVGGGPEGSFHYHGSWKWLTAAVLDLVAGGNATQPYLYGAEAASKGRVGETDKIERSFSP